MNYVDIKTKQDRVIYMKQKLASDSRWMLKALLTIYQYQTSEEQNAQATREHNNVGFTGVDGTILSSFAEQLLRKGGMQVIGADVNNLFSPKQQAILKNKMPKYARQLVNVAASTHKD
jgi:hypothetical protein